MDRLKRGLWLWRWDSLGDARAATCPPIRLKWLLAASASEPDQFDAEDAAFIAGDDGVGFMTCDCRAAGTFKYVAPTADHRDTSDDRGPAGMNAGDGVIVRPEAAIASTSPIRESGIEGGIGGKERAFVGHGSPGATAARRNQGGICKCLRASDARLAPSNGLGRAEKALRESSEFATILARSRSPTRWRMT